MTNEWNGRYASLPNNVRAQVDQTLVHFDTSWNAERFAQFVASLEQTVAPLVAGTDLNHEDLRQVLLVEALKVDIEKNWAIGSETTIEKYCKEFPGVLSPDSIPPEVLCAEYEARRESNQNGVEIADYRSRFPKQFESFQQIVSRESNATMSFSNDSTNELLNVQLPEVFANRFQIIRLAGEGGMGQIYEANDPQLGRSVAIKVSKLGEQSEVVRRRLAREARAAGRLRHPNICPIHDAGVEGDTPFIVMSFINGRSLAEILADKSVKLDQADAAQILQKVAEAVHYAHQNGIVHRDIKPSNILIDVDGNPIVTDFGLAQMSNLPSQFATPGAAMLGTPAYMSPEQAREARDVGPETDIYSLGVVLYEMLSGSVPFNGPVGEVIGAVQYVNPPSAKERNPAVDEGLSNICVRAMKKSPKARYQSAGEFGRALASSVERIRKPPKAEKSNRWPVFIAAIVILGAAVGLPWLLKDESDYFAKPLGQRAEIIVSTPEEFIDALKKAGSANARKENRSFRILLKPGEYDFGRENEIVDIKDIVGFESAPIIIESEDAKNPAVVVDSLIFLDKLQHVLIRNVKFIGSNLAINASFNVELNNLLVDSAPVDHADYRAAAIDVKESDFVLVTNCRFINPVGGVGLRFSYSSEVMVLDSTFSSLDLNTQEAADDSNGTEDSIGVLFEQATCSAWVDRCVIVGYERAIQFGGPTPPVDEVKAGSIDYPNLYKVAGYFEATQCRATNCLVVNSGAAFVLSSCNECEFLHNLAINFALPIRALEDGRLSAGEGRSKANALLMNRPRDAAPENSTIRNNAFLLRSGKTRINATMHTFEVGTNFWNVARIDRDSAQLSAQQIAVGSHSEILEKTNPAMPPLISELGEWMLDSEFEQFGIQRTSQVPEFLLDDPKFRKAVEKAQSRRPLKRPAKLREVPQSSGG